jgi:RNA polymerase sigma-70 factor (sigma-E family)
VVTAIDDEAIEERADTTSVTLTRAAGFERLYRDEYEPMIRLAFLLLRSRELGEEAVHDAFAKVYERWKRVDNPGGYLRTCVVNRCRDIGRRRVLERRHPAEDATNADLETFELVDALAKLPMDRRIALVLRYYDGLTERETAETLGLPLGTVKSRVSRGLAQLREEVTP